MADQISDKEMEAQKAIAAARSGFEQAEKLFKTALEQGKGTEELTRAANGVLQSALAIRVQIEAYPIIRSVDTYNQAMRGIEEGINEIKTALESVVQEDAGRSAGHRCPESGPTIGIHHGRKLLILEPARLVPPSLTTVTAREDADLLSPPCPARTQIGHDGGLAGASHAEIADHEAGGPIR